MVFTTVCAYYSAHCNTHPVTVKWDSGSRRKSAERATESEREKESAHSKAYVGELVLLLGEGKQPVVLARVRAPSVVIGVAPAAACGCHAEEKEEGKSVALSGVGDPVMMMYHMDSNKRLPTERRRGCAGDKSRRW